MCARFSIVLVSFFNAILSRVSDSLVRETELNKELQKLSKNFYLISLQAIFPKTTRVQVYKRIAQTQKATSFNTWFMRK